MTPEQNSLSKEASDDTDAHGAHAQKSLTASCILKVRQVVGEATDISLKLFKIMIPVIIIVKILKELDLIKCFGDMLSPIMQLVGLPGSTGLIWGTAMLTSLYSGLIVFVSLFNEQSLTIAQTTVLTSMMLVAHALPIELQIAQKSGVRLVAMGVIRMAGAFAFGWCLYKVYALGGWLQETNVISWIPPSEDPSLIAWTMGEMKNLAMMYCAIFVLLVFLKALGRFGVIALINKVLKPILILLGVGQSASTITIIGMTLGLGYGGGLIIQEATSGNLGKKDIFFSLVLMGLCHSLIEDTLIVLLVGGHISGIFWGRLVFSLVSVFLLVRLVSRISDTAFDRYLFRPNFRSD